MRVLQWVAAFVPLISFLALAVVIAGECDDAIDRIRERRDHYINTGEKW